MSLVKVFVSHTHSDKPVVDAMRKLMRTVFGERLELIASSSKEVDGIQPGANWFEWIVEHVVEANVSFVLITPSSVQKPWLQWEAGAVSGASFARRRVNDGSKTRPLIPVVIDVPMQRLPDFYTNLQSISGRSWDDIWKLLRDLDCEHSILTDNEKYDFKSRAEAAFRSYAQTVGAVMRLSPILVTEGAIQEWLTRLDEYARRPSEIAQIHKWMLAAFGREEEHQERPLDIRIHRRLADIYASSKSATDQQKALDQLRLARDLSPRDIYILREIGTVALRCGDLVSGKEAISAIETVDEEAFEANAECAALLGKYHRARNAPTKAVAVYEKALEHPNNLESYYLANLAAEGHLELGNADRAKKHYERALSIIQRLDERNIWFFATAANASLALGRTRDACRYAREVFDMTLGPNDRGAIEAGLNLVAKAIDDVTDKNLKRVLQSLRVGGPPFS